MPRRCLLAEAAELREWQGLQAALDSTGRDGRLQAGLATRLLVRAIAYLAELLPACFGSLHRAAGRLNMYAVELQHNCLLGFLNAREEAIEALPKLMSDIVVDGEALDFDTSSLTIGLHLDVERAHQYLQALQTSQVEASPPFPPPLALAPSPPPLALAPSFPPPLALAPFLPPPCTHPLLPTVPCRSRPTPRSRL